MPRLNARKIYKITKAHGWTEKYLAEKIIGISAPWWCDLKRGRKIINAQLMDLIGYGLDMDFDEFLINPLRERRPSAKEVLEFVHGETMTMADGRPMPPDLKPLREDLFEQEYKEYQACKKRVNELERRFFTIKKNVA